MVDELDGLPELLEEKMDDESSLFGLPRQPKEYKEFPQWHSVGIKDMIADRAVSTCLARVKAEASLRMERSLQKDGLEGFKRLLNSDSIIEELTKISMSPVELLKNE